MKAWIRDFGIALLLLAVIPASASAAPGDEVRLPACQPETLELGEISGWGNFQPGFKGEDRIIRDPVSWAEFWAGHSGIYFPQQPAPFVDFGRRVVIAVVQGFQPSGGGPGIIITGLGHVLPTPAQARQPSVTVHVQDDERQGNLAVITNPYHFVTVPRRCVPGQAGVGFRHVAPRPDTGSIRGTVWVPTNAVDWRGAPGVQVLLHSPDPTPPLVAVTGRDGSYFFLGLPPGPYFLTVNVPPYLRDDREVTITEGAVVHQDFFLIPGP